MSEDAFDTLSSYEDSLKTLKLANNKIKSLDKVLAFVEKMKHLTKLDLTDNEVCKEDSYREKVLAAMKKNSTDPEDRIILDGHDEDNISVSDDSEDEDEMGEEGELEMMDTEILNKLDPETREKFEKGELSIEELEKLGLTTFGAMDYGDEEGEFEVEDYGSEDEEGGEKKPKMSEQD